MRAKDLELNELLQFADGAIELRGRRLALFSLHAFNLLADDLTSLHAAASQRILLRAGYFSGQADAAALKRIFVWDDPEELLRAGPRMLALAGWAQATIQSLATGADATPFTLKIALRGPKSEMRSRFLVGYVAGFAAWCIAKPVHAVDRAGDGEALVVEARTADAWGDRAAELAAIFDVDDIPPAIEKLTRHLKHATHRPTRSTPAYLVADTHAPVARAERIEAHSRAFRQVLDFAARIAPYSSSVLITGESGVGKEVLARHMHRLSPRKDGLFLAVNCGALPETLLESELFGHKAGAFTGAIEDRVGLFEQATGGTIFLDEIGDITGPMQIKLLRVLQEKEVLRVGQSTPVKVDVRVIAATNRDLARAVREGQFREDLYYRLGVIELDVPPLRDRREDILPLARLFVRNLSRRLGVANLRLDAATLDYLLAYAWPGNVRELENALERAAVLCHNGLILPDDLPPAVRRSPSAPGLRDPLARTLAQAELDHIRAVLESVNGNRTRACKILGIGGATLWRKLKQHRQIE